MIIGFALGVIGNQTGDYLRDVKLTIGKKDRDMAT